MAAYVAIASQAVQNNLPPLLFIVFQNRYGISYEQLGRLILLNFVTQLTVDLLSIRLADKIGHRRCMLIGQGCIFAGLLSLAVLPLVTSAVYAALAFAVMLAAVGGGLAEVLVSPIVDAMPGDEKAAAMSMLHSFYCWGQVGTALVTTLLLRLFGQDAWFMLPLCWMTVPTLGFLLFRKAPIAPPPPAEHGMRVRELLGRKTFRTAMLLMLCAGASELTMSQWSSLFAEKALGIPKVAGDLLGPCLFGVFMGLGRMLYGKLGSRLPLRRSLISCAVLCVACYLTASLAASPVAALLGCAVCGFSVSLMWPGTLSMTAARYPGGGTALFAMLAVMGDAGCSIGPWLAGLVSDAAQTLPALTERAARMGLTSDQFGLKCGLLLGVVFPLLLLAGTLALRGEEK